MPGQLYERMRTGLRAARCCRRSGLGSAPQNQLEWVLEKDLTAEFAARYPKFTCPEVIESFCASWCLCFMIKCPLWFRLRPDNYTYVPFLNRGIGVGHDLD